MENNLSITVIGLGYVGLPLAIHAADAGFIVNGFDINTELISKLKSGKSNLPNVSNQSLSKLQASGNLVFNSKLDLDNNSEIYVIAVPTPLGVNRQPDLSMLQNACYSIAKFATDNTLIITESTSYIGTLRNFIYKTIQDNTSAKNLDFAVAPERIDPGNKTWDLKNTPRYISGLTSEAIDRAVNFYSKFCMSITKVSKPEIVEAAKLLENTFRLVNIALVNDLTSLAHEYSFSINEAIDLASTKPYGFMPFYPSIGVGGHCIPIDPSYLSYSAAQVGLELDIIESANKIIYNSPKKITKLIMRELGNNLHGKIIQIAGIAYKPNVADLRESPALDLIKELRYEGAKVIWFDPLVGSLDSEFSSPLNTKIDLGLIISPHDIIDFSTWRESSVKVLDLSPNKNNFGWRKFL
jgi:UDP-N-acetyl-D-glucosamine dehydrogenase